MENKWYLIAIFSLAGLLVLSIVLLYVPKEKEPSDTIELNMPPQFEVGQKFSYETNHLTMGDGYSYEEDIFTVNGTKEIEGREYYEIIRNHTLYVIEHCATCPNETKETTNNRIEIFYYDVENGHCIGKSIDPVKYSDEDLYATDVAFFVYWMLGLEEGVKWKLEEDSLSSYEFEVLGIEEVMDISCFRVKVKVVIRGTLREIRNYWICSEKRIMIEEEITLGGPSGNFYKYITHSNSGE